MYVQSKRPANIQQRRYARSKHRTLKSKTIKQRIRIRLVEGRRRRLRLRLLRHGWFLRNGLLDRHVSDDEAAAPAQHFAIVDAILLDVLRKILDGFGRWRSAEEFPVAHEVQGQEIAAHAVVEAGVT